MVWVEPVTNRTGGHYTHEDLNRVGGNIQYLADILNGYGYLVSVYPKTDWAVDDVPRAADMETYLGDVQRIKDKFYGTTALPADMGGLTHIEANNIEKLLIEIENYIIRMIDGFRYCGTFYSGQGVILP